MTPLQPAPSVCCGSDSKFGLSMQVIKMDNSSQHILVWVSHCGVQKVCLFSSANLLWGIKFNNQRISI